ncbi:MAG: hypothetical protein DRN27_09745 [Thermoplasmata archaeon]|nr:MAG: hypothetical protein DRN27_09745 [Thermoplasmata archaeon]
MKHNISTFYISLNEINGEGRDKQEQIKYYVKESIENYGIDYVLLIGNEEKMPVRYSYDSNFSGSPEPFISDLYYSDIYDAEGHFCSWDSNENNKFAETKQDKESHSTVLLDEVDLYPDVHLGRIPCNNTNELDIIINKIIEYENTIKKPWFNNMVLFGGNNFPWMVDHLVNFLLKKIYPGYNSHIAWEGEELCDTVGNIMNDFSLKKFYASATMFPYFNKIRNVEKPTAEGINEAINDGAGFVLFSAHGNPDLVLTYMPFFKRIPIPFPLGYSRYEVQSLQNGKKLPIVVLGSCSGGDFSTLTGVPSPLGFEFLKLEHGGSIASFCYTSKVWISPGLSHIDTKGGFLEYNLFKAYNEGIRHPGEMLTKSITNYLNDDIALWEAHGDLYIHYGDMQMLSLFGDPTLQIP